ncbi:MAG: TolC family protein, partial [Planctomycetota bacterium]|nr:TolC family protein [Planctomycetota bacterium]
MQRSKLVGALLLAGLTGCMGHRIGGADTEGNAIMAEGSAKVDRFREQLVEPGQGGDPRDPREPPVEVPEVLTLGDALRIAVQHSRSYKSRREGFFLTALGLGLTRRDFHQMIFSGSVSYDLSDGRDVALAQSTALALTGSRSNLPTGGSLTVTGSTGLDIEPDQSASTSASVSISQPLLRGRGKKIAWEPLVQSERNLIYEARSFEEFRQTFTIGIIRQYYNLVSQRRSVENARQQVENNKISLRQARALYALEQGTQTDLFRAEREFRNSENGRLDSEQAYEVALDRFKITLGLPLSVKFDVVDEIPEPVDLDIDGIAAIRVALVNRLDLLTARQRHEDSKRDLVIARHNMLPDLDLNASYSITAADGSFDDLAFSSDFWSIGLSLQIPFDRKPERNAIKSATISYEQSRRNLEETEDSVILEVRDAVRRLRQRRQQIENDRDNIETIGRLLLKADLNNRSGIGSNRDVVEATQNLTDAKNSLNERFVDYLIDRLNLLQQMGLLFVDNDGKVI